MLSVVRENMHGQIYGYIKWILHVMYKGENAFVKCVYTEKDSLSHSSFFKTKNQLD